MSTMQESSKIPHRGLDLSHQCVISLAEETGLKYHMKAKKIFVAADTREKELQN